MIYFTKLGPIKSQVQIVQNGYQLSHFAGQATHSIGPAVGVGKELSQRLGFW
jgi:hypothetical protein